MAEQIKEKEASTMQALGTEKRPDQPGTPQKLEKEIRLTPPRIQTRARALLNSDEAESFRERWASLQTGFVDEPRHAVEQADTLIKELTKRLSETFVSEQSQLKGQWDHADNLSTEELRVTLQQYRSFFSRLLSI